MSHNIFRTQVLYGALVVAFALAAAHAASSQDQVSIPAGTRILIRTVDPIDSSQHKAGFRFTGSLETNVEVANTVVVPRGTTVHGRLTEAQEAGRMSGGANLTLELTDIILNGTAYPIMTSEFEVRSKGKGEKTARRVVGGTGLGALIGGIAGGGAGAAIGAVAGAGAGTAVSAASSGQQVNIPSESLIEFRLAQPAMLPRTR